MDKQNSNTADNKALSQTSVSGGLILQDLVFFAQNNWNELKRFSVKGKFMHTVTCTEDNMINLYRSQFPELTVYGQVYRYSIL